MQATQEITSVLITQLMRPGVLREQEDDAGDALEAQYEAVSQELRALPHNLFDVLRYRYIVGYDHAKIAARMNLSVADVQALEDRALERLRDALPASRKAIAHSSAVMYQKRAKKKRGAKGYDRAPIFAWLDEHPHATLPMIRRQFGMAHGTAERIRMQWREDRQIEGSPFLKMPEPEIVARFVVTPIKTAASEPISAPVQSTWFEEQVRQARTFCEVLEEQERAAQTYLQTVQQQVKAARSRYDQAVKIAQAQHAMQRGQLVESIGG